MNELHVREYSKYLLIIMAVSLVTYLLPDNYKIYNIIFTLMLTTLYNLYIFITYDETYLGRSIDVPNVYKVVFSTFIIVSVYIGIINLYVLFTNISVYVKIIFIGYMIIQFIIVGMFLSKNSERRTASMKSSKSE